MPTTPNTITDALVFAGGTELISTADVELPDVNLMAEDFEQLGMSGAVSIPQAHNEAMTATIAFKSYHPSDQRAFKPNEAVQVEVRESIADLTEEGVSEFGRIVSMRALYQGRSNDTAERNRTEGPELELAVHFYKEELDGTVITKIDPKNRIFVFDGEDLLADRRANLGLE